MTYALDQALNLSDDEAWKNSFRKWFSSDSTFNQYKTVMRMLYDLPDKEGNTEATNRMVQLMTAFSLNGKYPYTALPVPKKSLEELLTVTEIVTRDSRHRGAEGITVRKDNKISSRRIQG